jgi:hypothetical protein
VVKSVVTVAYEILREVRRSGTLVDNEKIEIECAPRVAELLSRQERDYLDHLEKRFQKLIIVIGQKGWKPDQYRVAGKMSTEIAAEAAADAPKNGPSHNHPPRSSAPAGDRAGGDRSSASASGGGGGGDRRGGRRRRRGGGGRGRTGAGADA